MLADRWHFLAWLGMPPDIGHSGKPSCFCFLGLSNEEHVVVPVLGDAFRLTMDMSGFQLKSFYLLSICFYLMLTKI